MSEMPFTTPRHLVSDWEHLTDNEKSWIEFIRVISYGANPGINLKRVQALRDALEPRTAKGYP